MDWFKTNSISVSVGVTLLVVPLIILFGLGLAGTGNGAQAATPISAAPGSAQAPLLLDIQRFAKSDEYLVKNISTAYETTLAQVEALEKKLNEDPAYANHPKKAEALLLINGDGGDKKGMKENLLTVRAQAVGSPKRAAEAAKAFFAQVSAFNILFVGSGSANGVPLLKMGNYADVPYGCGGSTPVSSKGCAVVAMAMVLQFYGKAETVETLAKFSVDNGHRTCGGGTSWGFFPAAAEKNGLKAKTLGNDESAWPAIEGYLKSGTPVIVSGRGTAPFTGGGHFVVLVGIKGDTVLVNDPNLIRQEAGHPYPLSKIRDELHFATVITQ